MKPQHFNFWRWVPVIVSIFLMILVIGVSVAIFSELTRATKWREHTFQVVLDAQTFEGKLADAQRSEHAYATGGKPELLIEYKNATNAEMQELNDLLTLTHSDRVLQQRLQDLSAALQAVFSNDNKVISIYARQGTRPALAMDDAVENQSAAAIAIDDLEKFTDNEKQLLNQADVTEQKDYHRASLALIASSILAAGLLVVANYVAGREINRRRHSELQQQELIGKLQAALAEVKTLSGLIPICSWCKNIRNDQGFWFTVEQYVRAHTDASFTHGICPNCREKFKTEIAVAIGDKGNS